MTAVKTACQARRHARLYFARMKIFGTIFPFIETGDDNYRLGRHVANFEFLRALLTYSSFDEYHLFCLNASHFDLTAARLKSAGIPIDKLAKVKLFLYSHLVNQITAARYHVFHCGGWGYFLAGLAYLREKHSAHFFPITGCIHSLNGMETPYHTMKVLCAPFTASDAIICTSEAGREALMKTFQRIAGSPFGKRQSLHYRGSTAIIPLGVGEDAFSVVPRPEARRKLDISPSAFCVLSVARFSPSTKMDYYPLLLALAQLAQNNPRRELAVLLAGGGSDAALRLVRAAVEEHGFRRNCRVFANFDTSLKPLLYGAADAFIALSDNLQETFGISVVEAMAAGLPVVVSDINGYKELIEEGLEGFKIPTTWIDSFDMADLADIMNFDTMQLMLSQCMAVDTDAAVSALQRLMDDEPLRKSMGTKARQRAYERYRWQKIIGQYESLWNSLQNASPAGAGGLSGENPFLHDYLETFSHYPSRRITDSDIVAITPNGTHALAQKRIPTAYADVAAIIATENVLRILKFLAGNETTLDALCGEFSRRQWDTNRLTFTVLWMAKYGLIKIKGGA